jgi:hypothetical protein
VDVSNPSNHPSLPVTFLHVGTSVLEAVRVIDASGAHLAALMSDGAMRIIDEATRTVRVVPPPNGYTFGLAPPTADGSGNLILLGMDVGGYAHVLRLNTQGTLLGDYSVTVASSVFYISARGDQVMLVDRVASQVQTINLTTGQSSLVTLANSRARAGLLLDDGSWIVIHDTSPDFGVSVRRNGVTTFTPYSGGRWLSSLVQLDAQRVLVADYSGKLVVFDSSTSKYGTTISLPFDSISSLTRQGNSIYAVSQNRSKIAVLDATTLTLRDVWSVADVVDIAPADTGVWVLTPSSAIWRPMAQ